MTERLEAFVEPFVMKWAVAGGVADSGRTLSAGRSVEHLVPRRRSSSARILGPRPPSQDAVAARRSVVSVAPRVRVDHARRARRGAGTARVRCHDPSRPSPHSEGRHRSRRDAVHHARTSVGWDTQTRRRPLPKPESGSPPRSNTNSNRTRQHPPLPTPNAGSNEMNSPEPVATNPVTFCHRSKTNSEPEPDSRTNSPLKNGSSEDLGGVLFQDGCQPSSVFIPEGSQRLAGG